MKFKFVQFAILIVSVMSTFFMAYTPNGFGHDASEHPPEFYVDYWTGSYAGTSPTHMYSVDPRSFSRYSSSSGNGTESASSWELKYYATGLINGNHADDNEPEMIYGAQVSLSASAGKSSCSGSVSPSLTDDMGLTAGHGGWSGRGGVTLTISEKKDAHYLVTVPFIFCIKVDVGESKYDTGAQNIEIDISDTVITEMNSTEISASISYGPASGSAKWTGSVSQSREDLYSYPVGIDASLSVSFWAIIGGVHSQLTKDADVWGNLGSEIEPDSIEADFTGDEHDDSCLAF